MPDELSGNELNDLCVYCLKALVTEPDYKYHIHITCEQERADAIKRGELELWRVMAKDNDAKG